MARIFSSGLETQSAIKDNFGTSISTSIKRTGTASARFHATASTSSSALFWINYTDEDVYSIFTRFYLYIASSTNSLTTILKYSDSDEVFSIKLNTNNTLELWGWNGATMAQIGSDSAAITGATWENRIETSYNPITNAVSAYINGVSFASGTVSSSRGNPYYLEAGVVSSATCDIYMDDIAINDSTGSYQNSLPGNGAILHIHPNGYGDNNGWKIGGTDSGSSWGQVDEITPSESDYLYRDKPGNHISDFRIANAVTAGVETASYINFICVVPNARQGASTPAVPNLPILRSRLKAISGGDVIEGNSLLYPSNTSSVSGYLFGTNNLYTSYNPSGVVYLNPETSRPWKPDELGQVQIGFRMEDSQIDSTIEFRVNSVYLLVEFQPGTINPEIESESKKDRTKVKKTFFHKVYDSGYKFLTTWNDVMNVPSFNWTINGGMGEMQIDLARGVNSFGETEDVAVGNVIETWVRDGEEKEGKRIYTGTISGYEPTRTPTGEQYIRVNVASFTTTLRDTLVKSGSATTVSYNSKDISVIFKSLIDLYGGVLTYTDQSIKGTGIIDSYTFSFIDYFEALNKLRDISPAYWYWVVDGNNTIYFMMPNFDTPDHILYIGKQVKYMEAGKKGIGSLYNVVYFLGGGNPNLYLKTERTASISQYGRKEAKIKDERVTSLTTAANISNSFLDEHDHPTSSVTITVMDNAIDTAKGYDIDSIRPGQTIQVVDPRSETKTTRWYNDAGTEGNMIWDISDWDYDIRYSFGQPMIIKEIEYNFFEARITLATQDEDIFGTIRDIKENLDVSDSVNIPSSPS